MHRRGRRPCAPTPASPMGTEARTDSTQPGGAHHRGVILTEHEPRVALNGGDARGDGRSIASVLPRRRARTGAPGRWPRCAHPARSRHGRAVTGTGASPSYWRPPPPSAGAATTWPGQQPAVIGQVRLNADRGQRPVGQRVHSSGRRHTPESQRSTSGSRVIPLASYGTLRAANPTTNRYRHTSRRFRKSSAEFFGFDAGCELRAVLRLGRRMSDAADTVCRRPVCRPAAQCTVNRRRCR